MPKRRSATAALRLGRRLALAAVTPAFVILLLLGHARASAAAFVPSAAAPAAALAPFPRCGRRRRSSSAAGPPLYPHQSQSLPRRTLTRECRPRAAGSSASASLARRAEPSPSPPLSHAEIRRYSRHLVLSDVGVRGQAALKAAAVLVIGAGGLGSPALLYLAAAGVGHLGIVDADTVDESNLQRQIIHSVSTVGMAKAESAQLRLRDLNPLVHVRLYPEEFTAATADRILGEGFAPGQKWDVVLDGSDNFPTKYLIKYVRIAYTRASRSVDDSPQLSLPELISAVPCLCFHILNLQITAVYSRNK